MRRAVHTILAVALLTCMVQCALAAGWVKVGTSGFSTTASLLQDANRIIFNGIVVDAAGNICATANNGENAKYAYTNPSGPPYLPPPTPTCAAVSGGAGGVTIFKPNDTKIDIRVSDYSDPTWSAFSWGPNVSYTTYGGRTDSRYVGAIDKLVVAGDGSVYGLMHYLEIGSGVVAGRENQRIVRINTNGTIDPIYAPARPYTGNGNGSGLDYYTGTAWATVGNIIRGMTVGGDGNVYWTMNDNDGWWKYYFLWRYNVVSHVVEEAPGNTYAAPPDPHDPNLAHNNGRQQDHRMFDLEWVGVDPFDATNQMFAVIFRQKTGGSWGADWRVDPMGWKTNRWQDPGSYPDLPYSDPYEAAKNCISQPGYRDWITATAYDPDKRKLVVCGRGAGGTNVFSRWADDPTKVNRPGLFTKNMDGTDYAIEKIPNAKIANGNNTELPNGGNYWISALAIDPATHRGWMAFTGEAGYNYEPTGTILSWDLGGMRYDTVANQGIPEANAYTVGLTFKGDGVYALVCSKDTGQYSVYKATRSVLSIDRMKAEGAIGAHVVTDTPKLVTYSVPAGTGGAFFYIQDDNHGGGIKVVPYFGEPAAQVGERASVEGTLDVQQGEAVIVAYSEGVTRETTNDLPEPITTAIRSIGGAQTGLQPATYPESFRGKDPALQTPPVGCNTTGQLVRVVGQVYGSDPYIGFFLDDGSPYGIRVICPDDYLADGTTAGITGVSSTMWDDTNNAPIRIIRAMPASRAELVRYREPTP
jgi:hypothetical protein